MPPVAAGRDSGLSVATWTADAALLGVWRAIDPAGALPHIARVLDAASAASGCEAEIDVEMLAVDATSYREIRARCDAEPERMAQMITEIVAERGKLQNPWTGSGGVLMGKVRFLGSRYRMSDLAVGDRVVPLASLIAIPLALESVGPVDPRDPQVPVQGRAIVTGRMSCATMPDDLPANVALAALDVYPSASYTRSMARTDDHVLILGAGHAGLLAVAAAREAVGATGVVSAIDTSTRALARAHEVDPAAVTIQADVIDPVAVASELARLELPAADLTLLCTSVPGAEGTAILATAEHGAVLFFSTATRFAAAALGADAIGSQARLIIPNGLTDDRGEYALELIRTIAPLRAAFEG
jgi:L-erythro-3,5-diaminohexanoate dehydrogenase